MRASTLAALLVTAFAAVGAWVLGQRAGRSVARAAQPVPGPLVLDAEYTELRREVAP